MTDPSVQPTRRQFLRAAKALGLAAAGTGLATPAIAKPVTVNVMTWSSVETFNHRVASMQKRDPKLASKFNIQVRSPGSGDLAAYQGFRLALSSGSGVPDLVQLNYIGVPEFAENGALSDLGSMMKPYQADLTAAGHQAATYRNTYVAVPYQLKPKVWFYRIDLFEKAGIHPDSIKTFEDYMAAGHKLHKALPKSYIMNTSAAPIYWWYFMLLSNWSDLSVANRQGKYFVQSDPRFGEIFEWLKTWYTSGISFQAEQMTPDFQAGFAHNAIAGILLSSWFMSFLPKYVPEQAGKWAMTVWPDFDRKGSEAGAGVYSIPAESREKEAAFEIAANMFLEVPGALAEAEFAASLPVIKSARQPLLDQTAKSTKPASMSDTEWATTPRGFFGPNYLDGSYKASDYFNIFNYDPNALAELKLMGQACESYIAGQKDLDKALGDLQQEMESQIGNPYRA